MLVVFVAAFCLPMLMPQSEVYADTTYSIGDTGPAGGKIFYVDTANAFADWDYLEAGPVDLGTSVWSDVSETLGATSSVIGSGMANTIAIIGQSGHTTSAAKLCYDYVSPSGHDDWFLPSKNELSQMYDNLGGILNLGGFSSIAFYWSSTESTVASTDYAYEQDLILGNSGTWLKGTLDFVRPVRAFSVVKDIDIVRPPSPQDWVLKNLNINELLALYGPTPEGLVKMLYDTILGRFADIDGQKYWVGQLNSGAFNASQVVEHFIFSDELGASIDAMANEEFITFLYNSFLSRTPDSEGFENWVSYMSSGASKLDTLRVFMNNQEWLDICSMFNVAP